LPNLAWAAAPHSQVHAPPPAQYGSAHRPHGFGRHQHALSPLGGYGWPVVVLPTDIDRSDLVTHDFVDPRFFVPPPRRFPRSIEILSDEPVVFREPPHIIELRRRLKPRPPVTVVRRGVISEGE
jgi:hypothetical protein